MGLFSNVSAFVERKLKEKDARKAEEQEIKEIEHKALIEERIKNAPEFAKKKIAIETGQRLAAAKAKPGGSGGSILAGLQTMKTAPIFNQGLGMGGGMGWGSTGPATKKITDKPVKIKNAFDDEYEKYFGTPASKTKTLAKYKRARR